MNSQQLNSLNNSMNNQNQSNKSSTTTVSMNPQTQASTSNVATQGNNEKQEKVLITGDDILIEYVERLMGQIKNFQDD